MPGRVKSEPDAPKHEASPTSVRNGGSASSSSSALSFFADDYDPNTSWAEMVENEMNGNPPSANRSSTPSHPPPKAPETTPVSSKARGKLKYDPDATEAIQEKVALGDRLDNVSHGHGIDQFPPPKSEPKSPSAPLDPQEYPVLRRSPRKHAVPRSRGGPVGKSPSKQFYQRYEGIQVEFNDGRSKTRRVADRSVEDSRSGPSRGTRSRESSQNPHSQRERMDFSGLRGSPRKRARNSERNSGARQPEVPVTPSGGRNPKKRQRRESYDPNRSFGHDSTASTETASSSDRSPAPHPTYQGWKEPQKGWEDDPDTLARRQKDIDKGKNSDIYKKYAEAIPRKSRQAGHPRTPNKYLRTPRRSWDQQVRIWRKTLYYWECPGTHSNAAIQLTPASRLKYLEAKFPLPRDRMSSTLTDDSTLNDSLNVSVDVPGLREETHSCSTLQPVRDEESTLTGAVRNAVGALDFANLAARE